MPLPDLTYEEKQAIIQALQEANVNWPGFQPEAQWYKDFLVVGYWCPEFDAEPDFVVIGHGPAIVDTRDNSVEFYGSAPVGWTDVVFADDFPHGVVQLSDEPIPGCSKIKGEPLPSEIIRATPRNTWQGLRRQGN